MTTTALEKRITKTESNLEKLEQLVLKLGLRVDELTIKMDESRASQQQGFAELRASQIATDQRMEQGFAELRSELRKSQKQLNRQLGDLSNRLGTIVEDLVAPSLGKIFLGVTGLPKDTEVIINVRVKKKHALTKKSREFDALVELEGDGDYILVNETKSNLTFRDITNFAQILSEFRNYIPEYKGQKITIIGAMSSSHLDQSLITTLSKQGLLALAIGDSITSLKNPEGFAWKAF